MKAILVIEMPRNCFDCPLNVENKDGIWCGAIRYDKEYHMRTHHYCGEESRPSWCPLAVKVKDVEKVIAEARQSRGDMA